MYLTQLGKDCFNIIPDPSNAYGVVRVKTCIQSHLSCLILDFDAQHPHQGALELVNIYGILVKLLVSMKGPRAKGSEHNFCTTPFHIPSQRPAP